jgi:hypothetical protein
MKVRLTAALAVLAAGALATSAMAEPVVAKLQAPTKGSVKPVAGGAVFDCLGDVCAARSPASDTGGLRGCKELARQVGAVTSFGAGSKQLSADQLSECNSSARK